MNTLKEKFIKDVWGLLIIERSETPLKIEKQDDSYILEGIFTEFGVKNNNDRIYEEKQFLPHLDYLKEKIEKKRLLGELDHPSQFDISLSKVSHIIEKLEYDKENRVIRGRIRLLNTPAGKIAQSLVDSGVPLHISSRAAGDVGEGNKVIIKKVFTYDLVADPGFENAVLQKVNESLGYGSKNISIYKINEETINLENKKINPMKLNSNPKDLQKLYEQIDEIYDELETTEEESETRDLYMDYLANKLDQSIRYTEWVAETLKNQDNKNLEKSLNTLKEKLNNFEKITEKISNLENKYLKIKSYLDSHLAPMLENAINYAEYIAKNAVDKTDLDGYTKYLIEKFVSKDDLDVYSKYLSENIVSVENLEKYSQYISEVVASKSDFNKLFQILENTNILKESRQPFGKLNESREGNKISKGSLKERLDEKIDYIINSTLNENTQIEKLKFPFLSFLEESEVEEFLNLSDYEKEKIAKAYHTTPKYTRQEILELWKSALEYKEEINEKWIAEMPKEYIPIWESLSVAEKENLVRQAKLYKLDTPYKIKNFWETRNLNKNIGLVTESVKNSKQEKLDSLTKDLGYSYEYIEQIKKSFRK